MVQQSVANSGILRSYDVILIIISIWSRSKARVCWLGIASLLCIHIMHPYELVYMHLMSIKMYMN